MAKPQVRKSVAKAGNKKAPRPGRPVSRSRTDRPRRNFQVGVIVSKAAVSPESNSKPGAQVGMTNDAPAKNGAGAHAETLKGQSGMDLSEKIKELVRLAQEQGYLTYSDINDALPDNVVTP